MVSPVHIISVALAAAFALGLFRRARPAVAGVITGAALVLMTLISTQWAAVLLAGQPGAPVFTAGFRPPFSISLYMGLPEALLTLLVNVTVVLGVVVLVSTYRVRSPHVFMLVLLFALGANGVILTRDLFNLFVFLELMSIAAAGLIALQNSTRALGAGFKYVIAGAAAGSLMLLGIIFVYHTTGTLHMGSIAQSAIPAAVSAGFAGFFLVFIGIVIELKPFPANGWGLDAYQAAHPAVGGMLASGAATALFYGFTKITALTGATFCTAATVIGALTFLGSNLVALKQYDGRRMLGYSSVGQVGLLMLAWSLGLKYRIPNLAVILFGLLASHALAKALLFWLAALTDTGDIRTQRGLGDKPLVLALMGAGVFALLGMPPFPSFFAKFALVTALAGTGAHLFMAVILLGSLIEAVYLVRWLGHAAKNPVPDDDAGLRVPAGVLMPAALTAALLLGCGYYLAGFFPGKGAVNWVLPAAVLVMFLADALPARIKTALAIAAAAWYGYPLITGAEGFRIVFAAIFVAGACITLLPGFGVKGRRPGFYPAALLMFAGLYALVEATTFLQFFFAWELMTVGSYVLILRGKKSRPHALSYMVFSLGGAYLILAAFALVQGATGQDVLAALGSVPGARLGGLVFLMLAVGFLTKTAAAGLHIWLPGAHAEAEGDVSPMVSGILLKAGLLGLFIIVTRMGYQAVAGISIPYVLGWLGALTMLIGNYMAAMQEDAKRLLAYSSIGQMGFALFAIALMSHLGWLAALSLAVSHFIYKVTLFLAVGGVVARVKTKNMYEMGGLITRMPWSFIMVLISIIALSGIPPLAGYAAKWITYNAVIEKGWLLQGAVVSIAGFVAFLYLFRLIFVIFLGQLKDNHRHVKEAPFFMLLPQFILIGAMMVFSFKPASLLQPIGNILKEYTAAGALEWYGATAVSGLGYWNGVTVMLTFMGLFAVFAVILFVINRRAEKVKQFNIVYAAERPARPETTHVGYNFFAHYRKAVGFLEFPLATRFWDGVTGWAHGAAGFLRFAYTGNGQTYLVQIMAYVTAAYLLINGGLL